MGENAFYINLVNKNLFTKPLATEEVSPVDYPHTYAKESSPILIRLGDYVNIAGNNFTNNSAIFTGDF